MQKRSFLTTLYILSEQLGQLLPQSRKPENYLAPLLKWMTDEWKVIKKLMAQNLFDIASGDITKSDDFILEQEYIAAIIAFSSEQRGLIGDLIGLLVGRLSSGVKEISKDIRKQARRDANNPLSIRLTADGLQEVLDGLKFQKDFVDDLTLDTQTRIDRILRARYGAISDFSTQVDHVLRISRDNLLDAFHVDVDDIANKLRSGSITPNQFHDDMTASIQKNYRKIYRKAKGSPLTLDEETWIRQQAGTQRQYLDNFRNLLNQKTVTGDELTSYVNNRAGLYAERGSAIYEAAVVNTWPDDVLINWTRTIAESCPTCIQNEANNPYTKHGIETRIGHPGEGWNTICQVSCKCFLEISELYVSE